MPGVGAIVVTRDKWTPPADPLEVALMNGQKQDLSALSISALALSCLGTLSFGLLALPGVICGHIARSRNAGDGERAVAGAALIVGYIVLALFFGLPLLALLLFFLGSGTILKPMGQGFPGADLGGSIAALCVDYGPFLIGGAAALTILVAMVVGMPRLAAWHNRRQLRRLVAMNRSR
jgi:hypothetical protein